MICFLPGSRTFLNLPGPWKTNGTDTKYIEKPKNVNYFYLSIWCKPVWHTNLCPRLFARLLTSCLARFLASVLTRVLGEGKKHKHSVQYYPAKGKQLKNHEESEKASYHEENTLKHEFHIIYWPKVGILHISCRENVQFWVGNPMCRSKIAKSSVQGPKIGENYLRKLIVSSWFTSCLLLLVVRVKTGWFICNFGVLGKSLREVFWSFLTCFSGSCRSTFGTSFQVKIAKDHV